MCTRLSPSMMYMDSGLSTLAFLSSRASFDWIFLMIFTSSGDSSFISFRSQHSSASRMTVWLV